MMTTPPHDDNGLFVQEQSRLLARQFLHNALIVLLVVLLLLLIAQTGLIAWTLMQCYSVFGVSLEGRIFEAFSFSCPNPHVPSPYAGVASGPV